MSIAVMIQEGADKKGARWAPLSSRHATRF